MRVNQKANDFFFGKILNFMNKKLYHSANEKSNICTTKQTTTK